MLLAPPDSTRSSDTTSNQENIPSIFKEPKKEPSRFDGKYERSKYPIYEPKDRYGDKNTDENTKSPLILSEPANIKNETKYNPETGKYETEEKIGNLNYREPSEMSFEEFEEMREEEMLKDYWKETSAGKEGGDAISDNGRLIPPIYMSPIMDRIFGGNTIDIKPNSLSIQTLYEKHFSKKHNLIPQKINKKFCS